MVIKETALQLEDAVPGPPCWRASVQFLSRLRATTPPTQGRSGEVFCHALAHFGDLSCGILIHSAHQEKQFYCTAFVINQALIIHGSMFGNFQVNGVFTSTAKI